MNLRTMGCIVALCYGLTCIAQTAKVVELLSKDAARAKTLHDKEIALEKEKADFTKEINDRYLSEQREDYSLVGNNFLCANSAGNAINCQSGAKEDPKKTFRLETRNGWEQGFEYDETFKFIVPKKEQSSSQNPYYGNCWGGVISTAATFSISGDPLNFKYVN